MKKIINVLENNDFGTDEITKQGDKYYMEINQYTPEGEDWNECIWFDGTDKGFIDSLEERIDNFDIDEEVEIWVDSRGKNGVPSSIKALIEDAEWKFKTLKNILNELKSL